MLSNLALYFIRGSEKTYVSLQMRVCATLRFETPRLQQATRDPHPAQVQRFRCNRPPLLGQLNPHVMGELIPIMEDFRGQQYL